MGEKVDRLLTRLAGGDIDVRAYIAKRGKKVVPVVAHERSMRSGVAWIYTDAMGVERMGILESFQDRGGHDITYQFRNTDGNLNVVSGQRLKEARRTTDTIQVPVNSPTSRTRTLGPSPGTRRMSVRADERTNRLPQSNDRGIEKLVKEMGVKSSDLALPEDRAAARNVEKGLTPSGHRPLHRIHDDIVKDWKKPNFAAVPYLQALRQLNDIKDNYGADSAESVVNYFLSNASSWRGENARRIKAELKAAVKRARR